MQVIRTVRLHTSSDRVVRLVGDGTPENTRLLDYQGNPIPEVVLSFTLVMGANGCARGTFKHLPVVDGIVRSDMPQQSFEALVLFERLHEKDELKYLRDKVRALEALPAQLVARFVAELEDFEDAVAVIGHELERAGAPVEYDPFADEVVDAEYTPPLAAVPGPGVRELAAVREGDAPCGANDSSAAARP